MRESDEAEAEQAPPDEAEAALDDADARPSHARTRALFLRGVGVTYLAAFLSLRWQIVGLLGAGGLAPAHAFLDRVDKALGARALLSLPSLFWLGASDAALDKACFVGAIAAGCLILGLFPFFAAALCWGLYLSLVNVGQRFLGYQWDALLLEAGFLALVWAPRGMRLGGVKQREPSRIGLWLVRWLLFRLMFFSGFVKLASGDPVWRNLTALDYHYWTQPLPTWTSWYAAHLPLPAQRASCAVMFAIELGLPFLIFFGRRARLVAGAGFLALQALIAATGNYGFFNLLAVVLCIPLLDDIYLTAPLPRALRARLRGAGRPPRRGPGFVSTVLCSAAALLLLAISIPESARQLGIGRIAPFEAAQRLTEPLQPLHLSSTYGLFAVMTTTRPEIEISGSQDGQHFEPYVFRWKAGPLERAPAFVAPDMPRLDWQMWFDGLYVERMLAGSRAQFDLATPHLLDRLFEAQPSVLALLERDPFGGAAPRYLRWRVDYYRFTSAAERAQSGAWWVRTPLFESPILDREQHQAGVGPE